MIIKLSLLLWFGLLAPVCLWAGTVDVRYRPVRLEEVYSPSNRWTWGYCINDNGMVAGWVERFYETPYPSGSIKGVFYHDPLTGFHEVGDYQGALSQPARINDRGQFTVLGGRGYETNGESAYVEYALRYTPGVGFERLGDLGGPWARALGINSQGDVVGYAFLDASGFTPSNQHAFVYTDARGMVDLGLFGGTSAGAADINDDGWICGGSAIAGQGNTAWIYHEQAGLTYLGHGTAKRINEKRSVICDNEDGDPVLIKDGNVIPIRGNAEISPYGFSGDLNDWNVIAATGEIPISRDSAGYVWTESEGMRDLNKLIATNSGWHIWYAFDINNRGQITGMGGFEGRSQAFRLDPITPKPSISRNGTNIVVSWSPAWPSLVLETANELSSTNWAAIPTGGTNTVGLFLQGTNRFFRLNLNSIRGLCCVPE